MLIPRWLQTLWHRPGGAGSAQGPAPARSFHWRLSLLVTLLAVPCAHALEFQYNNPFPSGPLAGTARGLTLSGEVRPGDAARLSALMQRKPADAWYALGRVEVAVTGGDVAEALQLAELLAPLYPHTVATGDCAGACAIVWLSGAWRLLPAGRIGLQKPDPDTAAAGSAPPDAPPAYDTRVDRLREYLLKQGLPLPVYQRWADSRGSQTYWLSTPEVNATGTWPPYYYDKLKPRCPLLDATEEGYHALRRCAGRLVISQKAFAFDKLLAGANDAWWRDSKEDLLNAPR